MRTRHFNELLIAVILVISTAPLYAQDQQQNVDKLKVDTRNAVGVIGADKRKTRIYRQILDLRERQQEDQENNKNQNNKKKDKNRDCRCHKARPVGLRSK